VEWSWPGSTRLDPAIPLIKAPSCHGHRDRRSSPAMTAGGVSYG
jgi:hypothetical protein